MAENMITSIGSANMKNKLFKTMVALISILIITLFGITFLLKNIGMYGSAIEEKINALIKTAIPISLHFEEISGNPFTGFTISPLTLRHQQKEIFTASRLNLQLSLFTLLKGKISVSSLHLYDASGDLSSIMEALPESSSRETKIQRLPVGKIAITRGQITTPLSTLEIDTIALRSVKQGTTLKFRGTFKGNKMELTGMHILDTPEKSSLEINWGKSSAILSGDILNLTADKSLTLQIKKLDLSTFEVFFPALSAIEIRGEGEGSFAIRNTPLNGFNVAGKGHIFTGEVLSIPIQKSSLEISYRNRSLGIEVDQGLIWASPLSGDFQFSFPPDAPLSLDIRARTEKLPIEKILPLLNIETKTPPITATIASVDIRGPLKKLSGTIYAEAEKANLNQRVRIQEASLSLNVREGEHLSLLFLGKLREAPFQASGDVSISRKTGNITGYVKELPVEEILSMQGKENTEGLHGEINSRFHLTGNLERPLLSGDIHIPEFRARALPLPITEIHAFVQSDLAEVTINSLIAKWSEASLSLSGTIQQIQTRPLLDLTALISSLKVSSLSPLFPILKQHQIAGLLHGSTSFTGPLDTPSLAFSGAISQLKTRGMNTRIGEIAFSGKSNLMEIDFTHLSLDTGKKTFSATGRVNLPRENRPLSAQFRGDFNEFPLESANQLNLISEDIHGLANGNILLEMSSEKGLGLSLQLANSRVGIRHVLLTNLGGGVAYSGGKLSVEDLSAQLGKGSLQLGGSITGFQEAQPKFDLNIATKSLDLGRSIRLILPEVTGIQGLITSKVHLSGTSAQPTISGKASIFRLFTRGIFLPQTSLQIEATPREVKIDSIQSIIGKGKLEATVLFEKREKGWMGTISAAGKNLSTRILSSYLAAETRRHIEGVINFSFEGKGPLSNFKGRGLLTTNKISIRGASFTNVKAPFNIQDRYLTVEESTAGFYGGKLKAQLAADMTSTRWGGRVSLLSADTAQFIKEALPELSGSISGASSLSLQITGDTRRTSLLDVKGRLDVTEGEVTGFEGLNTLSKAMNKAPLSFQSISSNFVIDGQNLYILPGSRVTAPPDHPAYRYILIDGDANIQNGISLSFIGNVNLRALNIFFNALTGVLASGLTNITNTQNILSELLGGAVRGFSSSEFRDVSFTLAGKPGDFTFADFAVAPIPSVNFRPSLLDDHSQATAIKEQKISITVEIPIGRDPRGRGKNIKRQVEGQLIEQILHGLIGTSD